MRLSRLLKIVPLLVVVASLAGFFGTRYVSAKSGGRLTGLSPRQTVHDYRAEAASLRLAPGWAWPAEPVRPVGPDGRGVMYEKGYGTQAADYYWYCSWTSRVLDSHVTGSARRTALAHVLSIREKYYFKTALAPVSRPAFDRLLEAAAGGDVRGLRRDFELNCPKL